MAFVNTMLREQAEVKDRADELLSLCKQAIPTLDSLDKLRFKQRGSKRSLVGPKSFRRGVLMSVLQENAKSIPLWVGKPGPSPNIAADPGDHVAALVPEPDVVAAACNLSEGCILAEVVSYNTDKAIYEVEDVDAEEGKM
ncbi:unnamed protein product [Trichobilharzia regenti]|nr:unnamed protein product [Trichobilharzia regenti]